MYKYKVSAYENRIQFMFSMNEKLLWKENVIKEESRQMQEFKTEHCRCT